jgi:queuine/archaeosine tRNA-ribosyltransferase
MMSQIRESIEQGSFMDFKHAFLSEYRSSEKKGGRNA